jgi:hypothetical protein
VIELLEMTKMVIVAGEGGVELLLAPQVAGIQFAAVVDVRVPGAGAALGVGEPRLRIEYVAVVLKVAGCRDGHGQFGKRRHR